MITFCKLFIYLVSAWYIFKMCALLFSCIKYKIRKWKIKGPSLDGDLNNLNKNEKYIIVVPLIYKAKEAKEIITRFKDMVQGYKNAHIVFVTSENEEIEIKMRHDDSISTRKATEELIIEACKDLDRSDALNLIHYPYDNENKGGIIDYAVKEFMRHYETVDKMDSYVGIMNPSSACIDNFINMLERTVIYYKHPKILEAVNFKTINVRRLNNVKKCFLDLYNIDSSVNELISKSIKPKFMPYKLNFDSVFIRFDLFYDEEMLSGCVMKETVAANYYLKNAKLVIIPAINFVESQREESNFNKHLEKEFTVMHLLKQQIKGIEKYRRVSKFRKNLEIFYMNTSMTLKALVPYLTLILLAMIAGSKQLSLRLVLIFVCSMILWIIISKIVFKIFQNISEEERGEEYDKSFKRFLMKLCGFVCYPFYELYKVNGFYDYAVNSSRTQNGSTESVEQIRTK